VCAAVTLHPCHGETLHARFERQAVHRPDAIAASCNGCHLSYSELNTRANQVAHFLRRNGVVPETLVAICAERSLDLLIAVLGILKAGGAYLPIDPAYPAERQRFMIEESRAPFILTQRHIVPDLPSTPAQAICLDDLSSPVWACSSDNLIHIGTCHDLAYVIYTSGSTGLPKGVEVSHQNVGRLFDSTHCLFNFSEHDTWTLFHSCAFDFSVWEMWGALLYGGRVVVVPFDTSRSPIDFYQLLSDERVTVLNQTPSAFKQLTAAEENSPRTLPLFLRLIIFGGEALDARYLQPWFDRHGDRTPQLINMYGITETTVHVTYWPLSKNDLTRTGLIGRPISDLQLHILDENQQPVPPGTIGEIFIGGAGVARGYLRRNELTAERFIADPFSSKPGDRLYKTGDRARELRDGTYEYHGRLDDQVKIRGFRVELGEIEAVLDRHPGVQCSAVAALSDATGQNRLWGFFVPGIASPPESADLKQFLAARLPEHMIPVGLTCIETLPLTPNGKLDRVALTRLLPSHATLPEERPVNPTEARLLTICREIVGHPALQPDGSLLDSGFHSLAFAQLAWRIKKEFGVSPPFSELFKRHTVAGLASLVEAGAAARDAMPAPLMAQRNAGFLPLSLAQERVWFLEKLHPDNLAYHFQSVLRFHGLLDVAALQAALNVLVERHEILRTSFPAPAGRPCQRIHPFTPLTLYVKDTTPEEAEQHIAQIIRTPFDFDAPPVRWILFRLAPDEHWLLHAEHHFLHDGWEYEIFLRELFASYDAVLKRQKPALAPLTVQFADFAIWQRQQLAAGCWDSQLAYWEKRLHGAPPAAQLPADRARPAATFAGGQLRHAFDHEFYARLQATSAREGVTPYMWLHAAFQAFLHRYTGQNDIIVGSGVANRQSPEAQQLLGMIINTVALRINFCGQPTYRELLVRVRQAILEALDNQDVPFDQVVQRLGPGIQLFNTFFDTYDRPYPSYRSNVLQVERHDTLNNGSCKFDLVVIVIPGDTTPAMMLWEYSAALFDAQTAARMMQHFLALLEASLTDPELLVAELPMLSADEKRKIIALSSGRQPAVSNDRRIDQIFAACVTAAPDAEAIICGDERLTYRKLDGRAADLADQLRSLGLRPGQVVALCLPRGQRAIAAMLAIMRCDCAFLPIDSKLPKVRQDQLLQIAAAELQVTPDGVVRLPSSGSHATDRAVPESGAYVLFTSGTTGVPKAVCVPHKAVVRLVCDVDYVRLDPKTRLLHLAPLSFDACMLEIWGALLNGGTIVVHPDDVPDLVELGVTIAKHGVTTAWLTASLFNHVIDTNPELLRPLRELLIGGEALSVPHVARARTLLPGTTLTNGYGPTEAATFTATFKIPHDFDPKAPRVPIGRPLPDTQVYVLDEYGEPQPTGVAGEIYIGGSGVALCYLGDEVLTSAKFLPDNFGGRSGGRLYRTGDLGRLLADGNLDFLGRLDDQVKIRGFRVEPGEVAAVLGEHPSVQDAAVIAWSEDDGTRRLAAYVVLKRNGENADLQLFLRARLPEYMVPPHIVVLDVLPMLSSGKLDRSALPRTVIRQTQRSLPVAARTPTEEVLAGIWAGLLKLERVGVNDDFFSSGGHSLLALQLLNQVNSTFTVQLPLRLLFEHRTVASQAAEIERLRNAGTNGSWAYPLLVPLRAGGSKLPFFLVAGGFGGEAELLVYAALTRYLDSERPFYGLRIRGVDELVEPATVQRMAAEQIAEILRVQPEGPYLIGGSCTGGVLALEIAQQLCAQGRQVGSLILVDSRFPSWGWYWRYRLWRLWHLELAPLAESFRKNRAAFRLALKQKMRLATLPPEYRIEQAKNRIGLKYLRSLLRYVPKPYHGTVKLLLCEKATMRDPTWMWRNVARGGLDVHSVPGDHYTHLRAESALTSAQLSACLDAAQAACREASDSGHESNRTEAPVPASA
jgi:amino acid adenylation domain-containing protein